MRIAVFGAGAWGTAIACSAAQRHEVMLWGRDPALIEQLRRERTNPRYLPQAVLPASLQLQSDPERAVDHARGGLAIVATPMSGLREQMSRIGATTPLVWLCKGFEAGSGLLGHEIAQQLRPQAPCAVLSGPSFAAEVAQGRATALVAASADKELARAVQQALHGETLRIYTSADVAGVEVGGAMKNVLAIAAGILDGLAAAGDDPHAPGLNARAALITRGLAEMTRLGVALGAQAQTFMGLSGLGDLVLTATGALSRNRQVGLGLAQGRPLAQVLASLGHVAEGVPTAATALQRARALGVQLPITEAVVAVLEGRIAAREAVSRLMTRDPRAESDG